MFPLSKSFSETDYLQVDCQNQCRKTTARLACHVDWNLMWWHTVEPRDTYIHSHIAWCIIWQPGTCATRGQLSIRPSSWFTCNIYITFRVHSWMMRASYASACKSLMCYIEQPWLTCDPVCTNIFNWAGASWGNAHDVTMFIYTTQPPLYMLQPSWSVWGAIYMTDSWSCSDSASRDRIPAKCCAARYHLHTTSLTNQDQIVRSEYLRSRSHHWADLTDQAASCAGSFQFPTLQQQYPYSSA